jgi:hypothetical protein
MRISKIGTTSTLNQSSDVCGAPAPVRANKQTGKAMARKTSDTLLDTYCGALSVLSKRNEDEAGIAESRAVMRRYALAELRVANLDDEAVRRVIASCDIELLDDMDRIKPGMVTHWFKDTQRRNSFSDIAGHATPQFLMRLQQLSNNAAMSDYHLLKGMVTRDLAEGFAMALEGCPPQAPFHRGFTGDLDFIADCGPNIAPDMAKRLLSAKSLPSSIAATAHGHFTTRSIKVLSVLALAGVDLTKMLACPGYQPPSQFAQRMQQTASHHGQLELLREDTLVEALGRPETSMFFGIKGKRSR